MGLPAGLVLERIVEVDELKDGLLGFFVRPPGRAAGAVAGARDCPREAANAVFGGGCAGPACFNRSACRLQYIAFLWTGASLTLRCSFSR